MSWLIPVGKEESWRKRGNATRWGLIARGEPDLRDAGAHEGSRRKREEGLWSAPSCGPPRWRI